MTSILEETYNTSIMSAEAPAQIAFPPIIASERSYIHPSVDIPSHLATLDVVDTLVKLPAGTTDGFRVREKYAAYVMGFDQYMNRQSASIPVDGVGREFSDGSYLRIKFSGPEVSAQQSRYREAIASILPREGSDTAVGVEVAAPMNGAFNIVDDLMGTLDTDQRQHVRAVWMSSTDTSSNGALASGAARVEKPIDAELLTSDIVIFADDVLDSGATALRLASARLLQMGRMDLVKELGGYLHTIERLNKDYTPFTVPEYQPIYQRAAVLCREAGLVVAPRYSKNSIFLGYLKDEAEQSQDTQWGSAQTAMSKEDVAIPVGQDEWLVGGMGHSNLVGMLDTPVKGSEVIEHLPPDMKGLQKVLEAQGFDELTFRLCARLSGLGVLNGKAGLVKDFSQWFASEYRKDLSNVIMDAVQ